MAAFALAAPASKSRNSWFVRPSCSRTVNIEHLGNGFMRNRGIITTCQLAAWEAVSASVYATPQEAFEAFFSHQSGCWNSSRTYHYPVERTCESSETTFDVSRLTLEEIEKVIASNGDIADHPKSVIEHAQGFRVSFLTRMDSEAELIRSSTDLAFIPTASTVNALSGIYYRLVGYEEPGPKKAEFLFDARQNQLTMMTTYTRVVSVDEITLCNPLLRTRKIINYKRPESNEPLTTPVLVGFGLEQKCGDSDLRLVR